MTLDDATKTLVGLMLAALSAAVGWIWRMVQINRESSVRQEEQIKDLVRQIKEDRTERLTKEDVRDVINHALGQRDQHEGERRRDFDEALTLRIRNAVTEGVNECQAHTREELDRMVNRIADEVIKRTDRYRRHLQEE